MHSKEGEASDLQAPPNEQIDFCTLGMLIIDDIYPSPDSPNQTSHLNILGGAGTYSAIGARLLSPGQTSRSVGWIIDAGTDFPEDTRTTISSWNTSALIRKRDALTTRGWNGYSGNEHRAFKYLTTKKRLTAEDLTTGFEDKNESGTGSPALLASRSFHLICSATRCIELHERIIQRRKEVYGESFVRPLVIWEPVPDLCMPSELENTLRASRLVDVISLNHEELAALFGFVHPDSGPIDRRAVEEQVAHLMKSGVLDGRGSVVVRAGKEGCFVTVSDRKRWLPAYHTNPQNVIDPTGGGNGFLGGFAVGFVRSDCDPIEAACWGSVAASFCIEQVGVPTLSGGIDRAEELWNGSSVLERLQLYRDRTR